MVATYISDGRGKSFRAYEAEANEKFPRSVLLAKCRAARIRGAKKFIDDLPVVEWHHTGKYANETNYVAVTDLPCIIRVPLQSYSWKQSLLARETRKQEMAESEMRANEREVNLQSKAAALLAEPEILRLRKSVDILIVTNSADHVTAADASRLYDIWRGNVTSAETADTDAAQRLATNILATNSKQRSLIYKRIGNA